MHEVLDAVSLEIGKRVADRLRRNPELLNVARENLRRWKLLNSDSSALMRNYVEWEKILDRSVEEICTVLTAESEEGQRLRQNSPFAGILDTRELWALKKEFRQRDARPA